MRARLVMLFALIVVLNFQSCRKDGLLDPLRSKEKRISKKWDLVKIDGDFPIVEQYQGWATSVEVIDFDISFDFEEDGDFEVNAFYRLELEVPYWGYYYGGGGSRTIESNLIADANGEWELDSDKEEVEIDIDRRGYGYGYGTLQRGQDFKILRLKSDELVLEAEDGSEWYFED
ncbi:MAG: hypothetical protein R2813_07445 [Flavobacteriales bacterium]